MNIVTQKEKQIYIDKDIGKPVHARGFKKQNIMLKKDIRQNWGRFLDNHYDPIMHNRPFGVSMNAPKDSYRYSTAGLSHKFFNPRVLQGYDIEQQKPRTEQIIRFNETGELDEGDVYVFIEFCVNPENVQVSTRHNEKKYQSFAKRFRQAILEKFPFIKVYIKSSSRPEEPVKHHITKDDMKGSYYCFEYKN
jgi:hypothetical protein